MPQNAVLQRLVDERDQVNETIDSVLAGAVEEDRDPSESERSLVTRQRGRLAELEPQIVELLELEEQRQASRDARTVLSRPQTSTALAPMPVATDQGTSTTVVYRSFAEYARDELVRRFDQIASRAGMSARDDANDRLQRVVANTLTSDVPGLLPPQHITQIMQVIDQSRPLVDASRRLSLTAGKITYPRITGRPTVGKQAAEKTETTSTKMTVIMVEKVASTFLGAGDLSWQTINWSTPDALGLWFDLAAESYAEQTEADTAALLLTANDNTPVVVATDDLAGWLAAITEAAAVVKTETKRNANTIAADITTGYHLLALVSNTSPVFLTAGGGNLQAGTGNIAGLRLVISSELPARTVYVGDFDALLTAETAGAPVELRAVEPSIGGMEVGVIGGFLSELIEDKAFVQLTVPVGGTTAAATRSKSSS